MQSDKPWEDFLSSGSVADYLEFVNSRRERENSEGNGNTLHNGGFGNTGNERGRE